MLKRPGLAAQDTERTYCAVLQQAGYPIDHICPQVDAFFSLPTPADDKTRLQRSGRLEGVDVGSG